MRKFEIKKGELRKGASYPSYPIIVFVVISGAYRGFPIRCGAKGLDVALEKFRCGSKED